MQNKLHIACIQTNILWEDIDGNIRKYNSLISEIPDKCNLIVLPEMFATGFSLNPKNCAETMDGKSISWMRKTAIERDIAIMGSLIIVENNNYYNRLIFVFPSGDSVFYNKRHLFTLAGEDKVYTSGNKKLIVDYLGWKICPLICYDLRFPVWSRNEGAYDALIYVANWPKARISAWDTLLSARAIENMSYVIGVNRVGEDSNKLSYNGHTQGFNLLGERINDTENTHEGIIYLSLDKSDLIETRNKFQFLNDKDSFSIKK